MSLAQHLSWRATYLLGVSLLLPIGTVVLVCYYFTRMDPFQGGAHHWAYSVIAIAGGLSAVMAALLALFASATYSARVRFENEYRNLQRYLNEDVARERNRMTRNLDVFSAAQQVSMAIKQEVSFERILSVVLEQIEHFARSDTVTVFTLDDAGAFLPRAERRRGQDRFPPALTPESVEHSLVAEAARSMRSERSLSETTGQFVLAVYFSTPEGVRGVVRIARNVADEPDFLDEMPAFEHAVGQLVRMVSLGLKTANMWDRAIKDEKTGLYNANHYGDQVRRQVAVARRTGIPLSLIMLDIDKFKHVNDTWGHLAGDRVLAQVSQILMRYARDSDTPFRYGGEELCIVCAGTTEADAALAAERLRQVIACTEFRDDRRALLPITASFGVAQFDPETMAGEKELKEACDKALYQGKENGRNIVVVGRGRGAYRVIERTGDPAREVKRRMGLAGDNSPLGDASMPAAPVNAPGLPVVVDCVVDAPGNVATPATPGAQAARPRRKRAVARKRRDANSAQAQPSADSPPGAGEAATPAKPRRKRAPRKKPPQTEEEKLAAESDRLDYLTDEEARQLVSGQAPSKRLRNAVPARSNDQ